MFDKNASCNCKVFFGERETSGLRSLIINKLASYGLNVIHINTLKELVNEKETVLCFILSEDEFGLNESEYFKKRQSETIFVLFFSDDFFNILDGDQPAYIPLIDFYEKYSSFPVTAFLYEDLDKDFSEYCSILKKYFNALKVIEDNTKLSSEVADIITDIFKNNNDDFIYLWHLYFFVKILNDERSELEKQIDSMKGSFTKLTGSINEIQKNNSKKAIEKYSFKKYEEPSENELVNKIILKYGNILGKIQDFIAAVESNNYFSSDNDMRQMCDDTRSLLNHVCSLAVLGTFSSGKTTFINSLLMSKHKLRTSVRHNSAVLLKIEKAEKDEYYEIVYRNKIDYEILKATGYNELGDLYNKDEKLTVIRVDNKNNLIIARDSIGKEVNLIIKYGKKIIVKPGEQIKNGSKLTEGHNKLFITDNSDFILNCVSKEDIEAILKEINKQNITDYYIEAEDGNGKFKKIVEKDCLELLKNLESKFSVSDVHRNSTELYKDMKYKNITKFVFHGILHKDDHCESLKTLSDWHNFCDSLDNSIFLESPECYIFAKEIRLYMNSDFLDNCSIVDTPGFGSVTEKHDAISERYLREHKGIMLILMKIDIHADSEECRRLIKIIIQIEKTGSKINRKNIYFILNCFRNNLSDSNLKEKTGKIYKFLLGEGFNKNNIYVCNIKSSVEKGEYLKNMYGYPSFEIFREQLFKAIENEGQLYQLHQILNIWDQPLNSKVASLKKSIKKKKCDENKRELSLQDTIDKLKLVEDIKINPFSYFEKKIKDEFKPLIDRIAYADKQRELKDDEENFSQNLEIICLNLYQNNILTDYYNETSSEIKMQTEEPYIDLPDNEQNNFIFPSENVISKYTDIVNSNWGWLLWCKKEKKIQELVNYIEDELAISLEDYHKYYLKLNKRLNDMKESAIKKLNNIKKSYESNENVKKAIEDEKKLLVEFRKTQKKFEIIKDEMSTYNANNGVN